MSVQKRLRKLRREAVKLPFSRKSRIVLISDCHRSHGGGADNFAKNTNLYHVALQYYDKENYTYIELGDGDELWEGRRFDDIVSQYGELFGLLRKLYQEGRYHMLFGNHDMLKKNPNWVRLNLTACRQGPGGPLVPLFPGIRVHEALVLQDRRENREILLLHGHQVDFLNHRLWRLSRFFVRHVWKPLEMVGLRDPGSGTPDSRRRCISVEEKLVRFVRQERQILVAGHTHRPIYPAKGEAPYFNDGSCVGPRRITAIELIDGKIAQVQWVVRAREDGTLYVTRELLGGPNPLSAYDPASEPD